MSQYEQGDLLEVHIPGWLASKNKLPTTMRGIFQAQTDKAVLIQLLLEGGLQRAIWLPIAQVQISVVTPADVLEVAISDNIDRLDREIPVVKTVPWRHQRRAFWFVCELWNVTDRLVKK